MPPQPTQSQVRENVVKFLRSFPGVLRILQIVFGAGLWVTIAANKYEGSIHFVLFVAVLFWLLTLALFFLTLLDKQDLVPLLGGPRWPSTNLAHDVAAAALYLPAIGVMIYKTDRNSYCNLEQYKHSCLYKVYLTAAVFACLCCLAFLLSVVHGACRKSRGEQTLF
ncbi:MARVEL domain-containing protein 1 [Nerophis lumbriciformis]|uniref:MARVEL domain-containing protein 1 n=1 Tax=Nerophis lumbriciformis TaxID=546530 RepID=UPI002AE05D0E|nr:MARVEL domain-containing protein 1 [Nerophis lumbriciformis]